MKINPLITWDTVQELLDTMRQEGNEPGVILLSPKAQASLCGPECLSSFQGISVETNIYMPWDIKIVPQKVLDEDKKLATFPKLYFND